jgi:hypothetical protein
MRLERSSWKKVYRPCSLSLNFGTNPRPPPNSPTGYLTSSASVMMVSAEFVGFLTRILVYIGRSLTIAPATGIPGSALEKENHGKHKDVRSDQTRSDLAFK